MTPPASMRSQNIGLVAMARSPLSSATPKLAARAPVPRHRAAGSKSRYAFATSRRLIQPTSSQIARGVAGALQPCRRALPRYLDAAASNDDPCP
jgi:hypothetical protein